MNKAILIGNVGRDPNVKYFEGGRAVAQVTFRTAPRCPIVRSGTTLCSAMVWHKQLRSMFTRATSSMWKERYLPVTMTTRVASSVM